MIFEESIDPEIGLNVDIDQTAIPIAAVLPIYHPTEPTEELQEIHIYPKNVGYLRDPYFSSMDDKEEQLKKDAH